MGSIRPSWNVIDSDRIRTEALFFWSDAFYGCGPVPRPESHAGHRSLENAPEEFCSKNIIFCASSDRQTADGLAERTLSSRSIGSRARGRRFAWQNKPQFAIRPDG